MMPRRPYILLALLLLMTACGRTPSPDFRPAGPDSLYRESHILRVMFDEPEQTLRLLDTAVYIGTIPEWKADIWRSAIYFNPLQQDSAALACALRAYATDSVRLRPDRIMQVVDLLGNISLVNENYSDALRYGTQGQTLALQQQDPVLEAKFLFLIGECRMRIGDEEQALEDMKRAIDICSRNTNTTAVQHLSYFYGELMSFLSERGRYEEALETGRRREDLISLMQKDFPSIPRAYIDQQKAYVYAKMAFYCSKTGRPADAAQYASLFRETAFSKEPFGAPLLAEYLLASGQSGEVIALLNRCGLPPSGPEALPEDRLYWLRISSEALAKSGDYLAAYRALREETALMDILARNEEKSRAVKISELYGAYARELQIKQAKSEKKLAIWIAAFTALLLLLASLTGLHAARQARAIRRQNHVLLQEVSKLEQYKLLLEDHPEDSIPDIPPFPATEDNADGRLFRQLERHMDQDKCFLDSNLSREDVLLLLHVDKNRLAHMFREICDGISLHTYLNNKRLDYSLRMLRQHPNYTIAAIAQESGFGNVRNFQKCFKQRFSMTCSEYRRQLALPHADSA